MCLYVLQIQLKYETILAERYIKWYNDYSIKSVKREKTQKYPISDHIFYLSDNALTYGVALEQICNVKHDWEIRNQLKLIKKSIEYLIHCTDIFLQDPGNDFLYQTFRFNIGFGMEDVKILRKTSPLWNQMPMWLNEYYPKTNKLIWLANTDNICDAAKKMLIGIEKVGYTSAGYPQCRGADKFLSTYGFYPCVVINNNKILQIEWFRLNSILNKYEYCAMVETCYDQRKFNQWRSYLNSSLNIVENSEYIWQNRHQKKKQKASFKPIVSQ